MRRSHWGVSAAAALLAAAALSPGLGAEAPNPTFDGARWIWFSREPMPNSTVQNFPAGVHWFRAAAVLPGDMRLRSAVILVTADNLFSLYVNGTLAGESDTDNGAWGRPRRYDVAGLLVPGRNLVAVEAVNTVPGPAGLLLKLIVQPAEGPAVVLVSDETWKSTDQETAGWEQPDFDDRGWRAAHVAGDHGVAPWGRLGVAAAAAPAGPPLDAVRRQARQALEDLKELARLGNEPGPRPPRAAHPPADYAWPAGAVFVGDDCSLYRPPAQTGTSRDSLTVTIFNPHHSRAYPEHDLPAPIKVGRRLLALEPLRPGVTPRVVLDAGRGALGSPAVSIDGQWIYVSMTREGEAFFHIYRVSVDGDRLERLTDGPFHDIDPVELPDGRIAFTSTRIGTFEEYHNPPSRALFTMAASGGNLRPLTSTFIFDNEPEVLADGRVLFVRSDNFFDRGKVETLLHAIHPDGTDGYTEFGLELGPQYGGRLRAFNVGSPAPLPDGRVAFVTGAGIAVGRPGCAARDLRQLPVVAGDVAALPDGRLLCTVVSRTGLSAASRAGKRGNPDYRFEALALIDPNGPGDPVVVAFDSPGAPIHSPVYLGPRARPPLLAQKVAPEQADNTRATGIFVCQNARFTRNTAAGWPHVRAIRVLAGTGLTLRSSHSYIVHAGSEVTELGTVPLAPDGSFAVEVPADTAIAFQAVDAEGRSELNEMSWIYVRPGETRGCVGCHQSRQAAPPAANAPLQALRTPPLRLVRQGQPLRFRGNNAAVTGLMELQFDRYREVAGIDRHSLIAGASATGAQEVAALIDQLSGPDPGQRIAAAQRLAVFRDPAAAPGLAVSLRAADRELRVASALALAACGTRDTAPWLLDALADPDPLVAQAAAVAFENLTGHAVRFVAYGGPEVRQRDAVACWAWFRDTGWDKIEADLVRQLGDTNRDVVRRAAIALGHVGGDAARRALRAYVAAERQHNPYPEWRQRHNGDGTLFDAASPANPRTLQAATRALGLLGDGPAVALLTETLDRNADPATGNLFLAEAAIDALGRIGTSGAETALVAAFARLSDYPNFARWYGDHDALIACHASPVHYRIVEALDTLGSTRAARIVPHLIRSVPTDPDRALLLENDDCETLTGRVIRRGASETVVVEACLAVLGDPQAARAAAIEEALAATHQSWAGKPNIENRAAQILSLVCRNPDFEPRIRAAFDRYRVRTNAIPRLFDTGIPVVTQLPTRHWVSFFLARALGNLADPRSSDALIGALAGSAPEAAPGRPDPLGPGVLFLHNDLTPCWRAAVAWALGRIGDRRAAPILRKVLADLENAPDTRHAAARALERLADPASLEPLRQLAADYPEVSIRRVLLEVCRPLDAPRATTAASP